MPTLIKQSYFYDIYGNLKDKYTANAGDYVSIRFDFSNCCTIITSQTQQITYSALTGEVKLSEGSWIDEGFRVGDVLTFQGYNENNNPTYGYFLTITAIPSDKIIIVTGLPNYNNQTTPDKHIWVFSVAKQKKEIEFSINYLENQNTSPTPSMNSLIDSESQRMILNTMNSLVITNGSGAGTPLTQVGKKSGSFRINNPRIWRFNDDTYAGATRFNYTIMFDLYDFGFLFPSSFQGSECLKLISKFSLKTELGDTKTSDIYYLDNGNTGLFNEAFNSGISNVVTFPTAISSLSFNTLKQIPFSVTINNTSINKIEIGASYSTLDDTYNENQFDAQNKFLKILKSGLVDASNIGNTFYSEYFINEFYSIKLISLSITTSGGQKTFSGVIEFDPYYYNSDGFGNFIEARGDSDRLFYIWLKVGNTNCLLFGNQLEFEYPVGIQITPEFKSLINHDDNTNHSDMLTTGFTYADDINLEDDLAFIADILVNENDLNDSVQVEIVCQDQFSGQYFSLEKMSFDISNQNFPFWVNTFQNVSNNLPTSSAKKQAYLSLNGLSGLDLKIRLYYPFLIRWEYWIKQLNATAYFNSTGKNNKKWTNYADLTNGKLFIKIGIVRNGVMDFNYTEIIPKIYDYDPDIVSKIELIDNATGSAVTSIIKGHTYIVKATHTKTSSWVLYPYGQITIEPKESAPRWIISTEVDADISPLNPLTGNSVKRLDETRPNANTIIYTCNFDASKISGSNYCFTSKISELGTNNNPIFEIKITEDNIDKITEDSILKQIE
ncbi:hypothetical protein UFOVP597_50 [uncultured Caudovirales phage]|uniref:Uncharacterized protein n=1 Tax=uncultured Caudovirales phage TaxID=2100421 RepID=A0A6J5N0E6_9CAUD|nr:hypothetical protein UFOVP597_50 [uncultured Caudovirales phage]